MFGYTINTKLRLLILHKIKKDIEETKEDRSRITDYKIVPEDITRSSNYIRQWKKVNPVSLINYNTNDSIIIISPLLREVMWYDVTDSHGDQTLLQHYFNINVFLINGRNRSLL